MRWVTSAWKDHEDGRRDGQGDDAVGEHQPVAALGELLGHERVVGMEAGQAGEVGEARVGGQDEDQHRGALHDVERHVPERPAAEHGLGDLGDHRGLLARHGVQRDARNEMPRNMIPRQVPMTISVERAFFHSGFLNAGTPLEIASTPVMAAPPEAKACSTRNDADARRAAPSMAIGMCSGGDRRTLRSPPTIAP